MNLLPSPFIEKLNPFDTKNFPEIQFSSSGATPIENILSIKYASVRFVEQFESECSLINKHNKIQDELKTTKNIIKREQQKNKELLKENSRLKQELKEQQQQQQLELLQKIIQNQQKMDKNIKVQHKQQNLQLKEINTKITMKKNVKTHNN